MGLLNLSLSSYYALQTFSNIGIEREETHDSEKWKIPFVENSHIIKLVSQLEECFAQKFASNVILNDPQIDAEIAYIKELIDNEIASLLQYSKVEASLIEYANEYIIPIQMRHNDIDRLMLSLKTFDNSLSEYANLFLERFEPLFAKRNKQFVVRIIMSPQIIAMFFEAVNFSQDNSKIVWETLTDSNMLKLAIHLSTQKVSDKLFVQKDIRGFEKKRFYIIKTNEKRLWHKAIGYMDVEEFMDAILVAGRRQS